jgi:hypothetical protein
MVLASGLAQPSPRQQVFRPRLASTSDGRHVAQRPLEAVDAEVVNELAAMNKRSFVRKIRLFGDLNSDLKEQKDHSGKVNHA